MRYLPQEYQDYVLNKIAESDNEVICSAQPTNYFQAVRPPLWALETVYVIGDLVHPPTPNGKIYECTTGGTSGVGEPGWGTAQDQSFVDGTVTWKTHVNVAIANRTVDSADFVLSDDTTTGGRKLTISEEMGIVSHTAGTVTHNALICSTDKSLRFVTVAQTTIGGNEIEAGRTTIFYGFSIIFADPTASV